MPLMGITRGLQTWKYQDHYVERVMDNAAYTSAHPDDTLVLAGPARSPEPASAKNDKDTAFAGLFAIGHLQQAQFGQTKSTQPVMAIGSGRSFFVSGKAQGSGSLGRLFVNGRNLLRVLYHNALTSNLDVSKMDDKAANQKNSPYFINLDSELYLIPFGLAVIFRDKIHDTLGGFYTELTMITTHSTGFNAGQNMIMEQVGLLFDRMLPFFEAGVSSLQDAYKIEKSTLNAIMKFVDNSTAEIENESTAITLPSLPTKA